jgi:anti-sigma regulatory factor (Ser/Thr protein kinase)
MPGAPFTLADTLELPNVACETPATATWTFGRRLDEVPTARRFIRDALDGHPASYDVELLTCELVTNAVRHAIDADWVTIAVMRRGPVVHVDVIDDGRSGLPHWREATGQDEDGRGFQLVNEIAERWGFLRERAGTCVWFEIAPADSLRQGQA